MYEVQACRHQPDIFVDSTRKALLIVKKMRKRIAHEQALWYEDELKRGIEARIVAAHGKKPLKEKISISRQRLEKPVQRLRDFR